MSEVLGKRRDAAAPDLGSHIGTAGIFVPCKNGISQNEIEDAKPEQLEAGCNGLLQAMPERAVLA